MYLPNLIANKTLQNALTLLDFPCKVDWVFAEKCLTFSCEVLRLETYYLYYVVPNLIFSNQAGSFWEIRKNSKRLKQHTIA